MKRIWAITGFMILAIACKKANTSSSNSHSLEIKGADMSYLPEVRKSGLTFYNPNNQAEDMLTTLKNAGVNVIRLRLWKNPTDNTSGFETVKNLCTEIRSKGMKTLISVHYSDTWADPKAQTKPAIWSSISYSALKDSVYSYTQKIVQEMNPDYIQIGNEINGGLLWPDGDWNNPAQMKELLQKGISAVRSVNNTTKIIIHYAGYEYADDFFTNLFGMDYDIIGISYYPIWHGKNLDALKSSLTTIGTKHNKSILIAETSYPFTLSWNDYTNNVVGLNSQIIDQYPATPAGQKAYIEKLMQIMKSIPKGIGVCYWGAEWVSYKGTVATNASTWENQAFWDFTNKSLPVLEAFK